MNFIDENNIILGYDLDQDCCECAGWFISDNIAIEITEPYSNGEDFKLTGEMELILKDYVFDTGFYMEKHYGYAENNLAVFRIVNDLKQEKFIHIFNIHNGYYAHGFDFKYNKSVGCCSII